MGEAMTASTKLNNNSKKRIIGRPTKLTPELQDKICSYIAAGNYLVTACQAVGVSYDAFNDWTNRAKAQEGNGGGIYCQFLHAVKKAEAIAEMEMTSIARQAASQKKDGYLAITVNERRHPERWGRKDRSLIQIDEHRTVTITNVEVIKDYGRGMIVESEAKEIEEKSE